jgi:ribosomal protein L24
MKPWETPKSRVFWQEQLKKMLAKRSFTMEEAQNDEVVRRFDFPSLKDLDQAPDDDESDLSEQRKREIAHRLRPTLEPYGVKVPSREAPTFRNQILERFPDEANQRLALQTINKMPPTLRSIVVMALDPENVLPLSAFGVETREKLQRAREGDPAGLVELSLDKNSLDEVTKVGKTLLTQRYLDNRFEELTARLRPSTTRQEILKREGSIAEQETATRDFLKGRSPEGTFLDTIEFGKPVLKSFFENLLPEGVNLVIEGKDARYDEKTNTVRISSDILNAPGGAGTVAHEGAHAMHKTLEDDEAQLVLSTLDDVYGTLDDQIKNDFFGQVQETLGQEGQGSRENRYEVGGSEELFSDVVAVARVRGRDAVPAELLDVLETDKAWNFISPEKDVPKPELSSYKTYIDKVVDQFYVGHEGEVQVELDGNGNGILFTYKGVPRLMPFPSAIVEAVHGKDVSEDTRLPGGYWNLPVDSPLRRPGIGDVAGKLLADTAEVAKAIVESPPRLFQKDFGMTEDAEGLVRSDDVPTLVEVVQRYTNTMFDELVKEQEESKPGKDEIPVPKDVLFKAVQEQLNTSISEERQRLMEEEGFSQELADVSLTASFRMLELLNMELTEAGDPEEGTPEFTEAKEKATVRLSNELAYDMQVAEDELAEARSADRGFAKKVFDRGVGILAGGAGKIANFVGNVGIVLENTEDAVNTAMRFRGLEDIIKGESVFMSEQEAEDVGGPGQIDVIKGEGGILPGLTAADEPRQFVKREAIEPLMPEFEFDVPLETAIPFIVPPIGMANLALQTLNRVIGTELPTAETLFGSSNVTITDEVITEVLSFVLDPLNVLPVIGFAPEIIKLARLSGKAAAQLSAKLAKNPKFLQFADDALLLAKAEAGFLKTSGQAGEEAVFQARRTVLDDIVQGVETTDEELIPIRRELDNLIDGELGIRPGAKTRADEIQDALGFEDKVKLQKLGIDPQAIDDPKVLARIRDETPEIAAKIDDVLGPPVEVLDEALVAKATKLFDTYAADEPIPQGAAFLLDDGRVMKVSNDSIGHHYVTKVFDDEVAATLDTYAGPASAWFAKSRSVRVTSDAGGKTIGFEIFRPLSRSQQSKIIATAREIGPENVYIDAAKSYDGKVLRSASRFEVLKDVRRFLDDLVGDSPKEWAKFVDEITGPSVPKIKKTEQLLKEVDDDLANLGRGEAGGGRVRALESGDNVAIREGQFVGQRGRVKAVIRKGKQLDVELDTGRVVRVKARQVDAVDVLEEAAEFGEIPVAVRTRLERMDEIRRQLPGAGKKARKALQSELDELTEQAKLSEGFREAMRPGGPLAEDAVRKEQLEVFKGRLAKVKGEGRKKRLRRQIAALEESMELEQPITLDVVDEIKTAYLSTQEESINHLIRRQDEINFQLIKRRETMTGDELAELEHRGKEIREELTRIRGEADSTVENIVKARQEMLEGALTPTTLTLEEFETFAFSKPLSPIGRVSHAAGHVPGLRKFVNWVDSSIFHRDHFIGRTLVAYERLSEALAASTETSYRALTAKGVPFKRTTSGLEEVTGQPLFDVVENWGQYRHMFGAEQDEFVQLLNQTRLEALRDMEKLGVIVPDAWFEATHVFRKAIGKDGINFKALSRHAEVAKPGSLRRRGYEAMANGHAGGVKYDQDIVGVHISAVHALREHAAKKAFLNRIKYEKGVPLKLFVAQERKLTTVLAAREYSWAKVVQKYVHQSVRGKPPKPGLRASTLYDIEPPDDLVKMVARVAVLNKGKRNRGVIDEIRRLRIQIDDIAKRDSARLKVAKSEYKVARESVNTQVQSEGVRFGRPGEAVAISPAPVGTFPELGGRLYLTEDMDYLMKVAGDSTNPFVGIAKQTSRITGVMKVFQTALDPGFWFIQGLGAAGLDFANLMRGRPTAIWAKSAYRSLVGLTRGRKAAEFWSGQAAKHPDEWAEFLQFGRILSNHTEYADELVAEAMAGGFIEKLERAIPIVNKVHPFARAGNAFANFMDAAAWETWKSLRPLAKNTDDMEQLGAFVRNISGRNSTRGLGMSHGQEMVERTLLYARSYTRAGAAIMAKAAFDPASFGGRQAFKSLAGLGAASTFILAAATVSSQLIANGGDFGNLDWDDLGDRLKKHWTPWDSQFMGTRIGDQVIGMGGTVRSNISLVARLGKMGFDDPKNLNPFNLDDKFLLNFKHPVIRFLRGKSSPLVGTAWDIFTGEDFLGYAIDDPKDLLRLPLSLAPFAAQNFVEQTGIGFGERTGVTTAEWFGIRNFPIGAWQLYKEEAERALGDTWDNIASTDRLRMAEQDEENYPELVERKLKLDEDQRARKDEFQKIEDILAEGKEEKVEKLVPLAREIDWGRPGGGELFAEQNKFISAQYRNDFDVAAKALGVELNENPEYKGKDAMLEAELIELEPLDFRDEENNIDWDAYNEAADAIKAQMSPANRTAAENKRFNVGDPQLEEALRRRQGAIDNLDPYFNAPKYKDLSLEEGEEVDELLGLVSEIRDILVMQGVTVGRPQILQFMLEAKLGDTKIISTAWVASKSNISYMVKSTVQRDLVFQNPDMVVFYPFVFYDLSEEEQEEWMDMHGRGASRGLQALQVAVPE